jgi:hypothetical protein
MGGRSAPRSVEQGAGTIVWLATLPGGGPSGKFFEDQKELDWYIIEAGHSLWG